MDALLAIISIVVGAIVSALLSVAFAEDVVFHCAWFMQPFVRRKTNVSGIWDVTYPEFGSTDPNAKLVNLLLRVRQVGDYVVARNIEGRPEYRMKARVFAGRYLSGTWADYSRSQHYGSFQVGISDDGKSMKGKWLGFSAKDENYIRDGEWTWLFRGEG